MKTNHLFYNTDARDLDRMNDDAVDLIVTSPPYPMVEMWDSVFEDMNEEIGEAIENEEERKAFNLMHDELDKVWDEVDRVTSEDSIVAINIGDATRKVNSYQLYPNHSRIHSKFLEMGYEPLPLIIWRKLGNKGNKYFGSVNLPPNSYVTQEHEYILLFRKNGVLDYTEEEKKVRYNSSYFYDERNQWFSDFWELNGSYQDIDADARDRSAEFPIEIPYRLINMFSIQGDTVLDPFAGTGTTSVASAMSARNSICVDIENEFLEIGIKRFEDLKEKTEEKNENRIQKHLEYVEQSKKTMNYETDYNFGAVTKQAKEIQIPYVENVKTTKLGHTVEHTFDRPQARIGSYESSGDE